MNNFEIVKELLKKDRSIRRFDEQKRIEKEHLEELVDLTRYCASGRNLQPLKYLILSTKEECESIFPLLGWAGYLKDWPGPVSGERPTAYLVQCLDTRLTNDCLCDDGLQLQTLTLGACAKGFGGCIIKSFNQKKVSELFSLEDYFLPIYVLALGYPVEKVVIENMNEEAEDAYKYFRTPDEVHHVPKRSLESLIIPVH